jgi:hypothetical protein
LLPRIPKRSAISSQKSYCEFGKIRGNIVA